MTSSVFGLVFAVLSLVVSVVPAFRAWRQRKRPPRGQRYYEFRDRHGGLYGKPVLAENACHFVMLSRRTNVSARTPDDEPNKNPLLLIVTATGEYVKLNSHPSGAGVRLQPGFPWFNADGREINLKDT